MTRVHCMRQECTHYCGRYNCYDRAIGKPVNMSVLGNPFFHKDPKIKTKKEAIRRFRLFLNEERKSNSIIWRSLIQLPQDAVLGCFCDEECHCDVIINAWNWYHNHDSNRY